MKENKMEELKQTICRLDDERKNVEIEMNACLGRLNDAGVGLNGSLVDQEGFPRSDIDVVSVRSDRQRVHVLTNDYKSMSDEIESLLHKLHAMSRGEDRSSSFVAPPMHTTSGVPAGSVAAPIGVPASSTVPFAVVDEVLEGSPAHEADVRVGDEIVSCGHVTGQTPNSIETMGRLISESENMDVHVVVLRDDERIELNLRPRTWSGRGVLGCHVMPMKK